jgi:two-component system nitrate/nitrite response regulator NarL
MAAECGTTSEALTALACEEIDVILLDFDLDNDTGTRFIPAAVAAGFRGKILMVTAGMSAPEVSAARRLGISGIFPKHDSPKALLDAIRKVASGDGWTKSVSPAAVKGQVNSTLPPSRLLLTQREQIVLRSVFEGRSNKEIARHVGASLSSIKGILQQLFEKMGARTRAQLVRMAIEHSLDAAQTPLDGAPPNQQPESK